MHYTSKEVYEYISKQTNDPIVEWKTCEVSGAQFPIYQSDLEFYDKVSPVLQGVKYQIPAPKLCPEERERRRMSFVNLRKLYRRTCDASGKVIISIYSPEKVYTVYEQTIRHGEGRNPLKYGQKWNGEESFFELFDQLLHQVPLASLTNIGSENAEYCAMGSNNKNCYLIVGCNSENCYYGMYTNHSSSCMDYFFSIENQECYEIIDAKGCYKVFYSQEVRNCSESAFLYNCEGCQHCFCCVNLKNQSYCIFNKQVSKEEYFAYWKEKFLNPNRDLERLQAEFDGFKSQFPLPTDKITQSEQSFGINLSHAHQSAFIFDADGGDEGILNSKYSSLSTSMHHCYDLTDSGNASSWCYEGMTVSGHKNLFCINVIACSEVYYSHSCQNCSHLFGCVGLKHKQYCIFNVQYSKEEYEEVLAKLIAHMQKTWERGQFFPAQISPFGYNETMAMEFFPLSKEQATKRWYQRMDEDYPINIPTNAQTLNAKDLPENIDEVSDDILNKVILCETTWRPFRIIKAELDFYRKHNIALPHKHPDIRHIERINLRDPRKLFHRQCNKCGKAINTSYAPERPEVVYCESCYQKEIG